jgi:hypothetical protein
MAGELPTLTVRRFVCESCVAEENWLLGGSLTISLPKCLGDLTTIRNYLQNPNFACFALWDNGTQKAPHLGIAVGQTQGALAIRLASFAGEWYQPSNIQWTNTVITGLAFSGVQGKIEIKLLQAGPQPMLKSAATFRQDGGDLSFPLTFVSGAKQPVQQQVQPRYIPPATQPLPNIDLNQQMIDYVNENNSQ